MIKRIKDFLKKKPKVKISYYENGQKEFEVWYLNGKRHREDGPAVQRWYPNGQKKSESWWLYDEKYSRKEWIKKLKEIGSPHYEEQKEDYEYYKIRKDFIKKMEMN